MKGLFTVSSIFVMINICSYCWDDSKFESIYAEMYIYYDVYVYELLYCRYVYNVCMLRAGLLAPEDEPGGRKNCCPILLPGGGGTRK
jgi:hypothetical protein